jgi:hypothetical protein
MNGASGKGRDRDLLYRGREAATIIRRLELVLNWPTR